MAERRLAIVVGNDLGQPREVQLRFAQRDAVRVAQALRELGGVSGASLRLLLGADADALRRALDETDQIAVSAPGPVTLLLFYSGHADAEALHLGPTLLTWAELRDRLAAHHATLKVGFVDACQAGAIARGMMLAPAVPTADPTRGTAMLVSADTGEAALESVELGASVFTHYLVSGLRGAADLDGDQRVTLGELTAWTSRRTQEATTVWGPSVQHPRFRFEISGHGDVALTDLREGSARLELDESLAGMVSLVERGSSQVLVESDKRAGAPLRFSLPAGRYGVVVRDERAVYLAEVTLPWGGGVRIARGDLSARSYQDVAQKGDELLVRRWRFASGLLVRTPLLAGLGALPGARLALGLRLGVVELGLDLAYAQKTFTAADALVANRIASGALRLGGELPLRWVDLRLWAFADAQAWIQNVPGLRERRSLVPGLGAGGGVRVPISPLFFGELDAEVGFYEAAVEGSAPQLRPAGQATLMFGIAL